MRRVEPHSRRSSIGGITFTKDFVKGQVESYYSRAFLNYTHTDISRNFRWNYSVIDCLNSHYSIMPLSYIVGSQKKNLSS